MKSKILKFSSIIVLSIILIVIWLFTSFQASPVYAATDSSTVLSELRADPNFDEADYPDNPQDYSLQVIQIGEDEDNELYIYTYQPAHDSIDLKGTKISISCGYSVNGSGLTPSLYDLELVSTSGVFDKYHVKGFTPSKDGDRYYNIVSIYREFNSVIDESDDEFPTTDIAYPVGQQWYAHDINDTKVYEMNTFNTLEVDTVYNGRVTLKNGFQIGDIFGLAGMCDAWFFCFDVEDYVISHIYDADLNYSIRHVIQQYFGTLAPWETPDDIAPDDEDLKYSHSNVRENLKLTLSDEDTMSFSGSGLGARTYSWNRILPAEEFIATVEDQGGEFSETDKLKIESSQYVFSFLETSRSEFFPPSNVGFTLEYEEVYDVGLLRLHFMDVNQKVYDLGVVNNLTTPDSEASATLDPVRDALEDFFDKFVKVIGIIVLIILLVVCLNFIGPISTIFSYLFKGLVFVVTLPFKLIKSLFKRK